MPMSRITAVFLALILCIILPTFVYASEDNDGQQLVWDVVGPSGSGDSELSTNDSGHSSTVSTPEREAIPAAEESVEKYDGEGLLTSAQMPTHGTTVPTAPPAPATDPADLGRKDLSVGDGTVTTGSAPDSEGATTSDETPATQPRQTENATGAASISPVFCLLVVLLLAAAIVLGIVIHRRKRR